MAFTFLKFLVTLAVFCKVEALFELTNVNCIPLDREFGGFEYCFLKSVNRTYKFMSVKANLYQVPVTNVTVSIQLMKKANGYKPFLYNFTFDACKFFKSTKKNIVINYFYELIRFHSNMNHTCPYDHDLIVEKLDVSFLNHQTTAILPVPDGEYAIFSTWSAYGIPRGHIRVFGTKTLSN